METFASIDAEEALCGLILLDGTCMAQLAGTGLREEDFQGERTRVLYAAAAKLYREKKDIDPVAIRLQAPEQLSRDYLITLMEYCPICRDPLRYAKEIRLARLRMETATLALKLTDRTVDMAQGLEALGEVLRKKAQMEARRERGVDHFRAFIDGVQAGGFQSVPTGFPELDRLLDGGLRPQELVLLGGAPAIGKTAFAQQVFENIAASGRNVLYFNLEMSRSQLYARSLSRWTAENGREVPVSRVLDGVGWTEEETAAIEEASRSYIQQVAPRMTYNLEESASLDDLLGSMISEAEYTRAQEGQAPIVVVDYLQILEGTGREDQAETIKRAVKRLKNYAIEYDTTVFAIIANNREANRTGFASLDSGRDTSAIEYSADTMLQLVYTACLDKASKMTPEDILSTRDTQERRRLKSDVTLRLVKRRGGEAGGTLRLHFDGGKSRFSAFECRDFKLLPGAMPGDPFV